ncbi:hypothetical protein BJY04DRAFT_213638 [Aspergillus karnatakaensis]|uniref:uncharacterized protein n=1 Tax=Aspergillus karnatakaensis TaxID=1810916 RepID=UPI003CCE10FF
MARRAHKKSRNGCLECKRRHVKCDEKRPICANCIASERQCEYGTQFLNNHSGSSLGGSPVTATPLEGPSPVAATSPSALDDQPVSMLHAELFQNLFTNTYTTFDPNRALPWLAEGVINSLTTPYFVNELLAFSALHLSVLQPHRKEHFQYHAARLQTHALSIFQETSPEVSKETCVQLFLFTSILGVHMLCDTLIYREGDLDHFLGRFSHYIHVHQGVRTVVFSAWPLLHDSPVKLAFEISPLYQFDGHFGPGCGKLSALVQAANLGTELTQTYQQAIEKLQTCTNLSNAPLENYAPVNGLISWPLMVSLEFSGYLQEKRPEALVIFAHYAVLLYQHQDSWLFADFGRFIIDQVTRYLGVEWEEWLSWPRRALES